MAREDFSNLGKIMLVCSDAWAEVEECLLAVGHRVVKVRDGNFAVVRARREFFDTAVLVSTGKAIDLAETFFALRDINESMNIIIIADWRDAIWNDMAQTIGTSGFAKTCVLTITELQEQLASVETWRSRKIEPGH